MKLDNFVKLGTAGVAVLGFGASALSRFLPERFNQSEYGLQLFVLREFQTELLTLGLACVVAYVFWDGFARALGRVARMIGAALAKPSGVYGAHARVASAVAIMLTAIVVAGAAVWVGRQAVFVGKVNYVYLRDVVAGKYRQFLWREVRLAQAALDYGTATRVLEQIVKHYPEDGRAKSEIAFVNNVFDAAKKLAAAGRESIERYGANPGGLALLAEAYALNPRDDELRRRLERALSAAVSGELAREGISDRCEGQQHTTVGPGGIEGIPQRAIAYLIEPGDRGGFAGRDAQQSLLRGLCRAVEEEEHWLVESDAWRQNEILSLLAATDTERLAARGRDFRLGWSILDLESAGRTVVASHAPRRLAGRVPRPVHSEFERYVAALAATVVPKRP